MLSRVKEGSGGGGGRLGLPEIAGMRHMASARGTETDHLRVYLYGD